MRLIDADDFGNRMYHEAFEKDSDLQKWDSGCWIRYKLFENVLREQPTVQPEPHWIPCSEGLPEENCRCLTTNKAWGAFEVDWNAWIDGQWLYPNEKPVAWMPLPDPYRGGEK